MSSFKGVIPYLATPIDRDGEVRSDVLARLCDDLIKKGVHGLTPLGSTGEFAYLDRRQKARVVEATVQAARGRVPVIAGVASTSTVDAISQAKAYHSMGVTGLVAVLDAYFPLKDPEIERYFVSIADATDLPVVLYTNPNFQRADLSIELIERLSYHPNIVGLKDASTNTGRLLSIMNRCADRLDVFAASAHIPACVMMIGGKGWFAGPACVIPEPSVKLYQLCVERRWDEALILQKELWVFNEMFARFNLAACVKSALPQQGYEMGRPIAPQKPLSIEEGALVTAAVSTIQARTGNVPRAMP